VITTHYSNLKIFAYKTKGLVNGSMHFDKDTLSPTYELQVGRPGSSYAFEIATKSGLPGRVLKYAKQRIGKNERAVDQLLVDLQREKQEIEEQLAQLQAKQSTLDHLTKTYEQMHRDMEFRRKRLKLEVKEQALTETAQQNKEMERVIREIKEKQNIERAKEVAAKVREERNELANQVTDLRENIYYQDDKKKKTADREIREGDFVKMRTGGATGQVESVDKNRAILTMGGMRMTVKLRDLQLANTPLEIQSSRSVRSDVDRVATFDTKLDIRGMRFEEAMQVVETFIDQAILADANKVQIVHGKGSGALRKAVHKKLREYRLDLNVYHPERQGGGEGATIVEF
jgi:DNA mismatch repair protein MutS2